MKVCTKVDIYVFFIKCNGIWQPFFNEVNYVFYRQTGKPSILSSDSFSQLLLIPYVRDLFQAIRFSNSVFVSVGTIMVENENIIQMAKLAC